jgi:hypothetical protein
MKHNYTCYDMAVFYNGYVYEAIAMSCILYGTMVTGFKTLL